MEKNCGNKTFFFFSEKCVRVSQMGCNRAIYWTNTETSLSWHWVNIIKIIKQIWTVLTCFLKYRLGYFNQGKRHTSLQIRGYVNDNLKIHFIVIMLYCCVTQSYRQYSSDQAYLKALKTYRSAALPYGQTSNSFQTHKENMFSI